MGRRKNKLKASPYDIEWAAHMKMRQQQNIKQCRPLKGEAWMAEKLRGTGHKWTRQIIHGWRLFDFWCPALGIAVEADGPFHDPIKDKASDEEKLRRNGIVVLRVPNFDEPAANEALRFIASSETWKARRLRMGILTSLIEDPVQHVSPQDSIQMPRVRTEGEISARRGYKKDWKNRAWELAWDTLETAGVAIPRAKNRTRVASALQSLGLMHPGETLMAWATRFRQGLPIGLDEGQRLNEEFRSIVRGSCI